MIVYLKNGAEKAAAPAKAEAKGEKKPAAAKPKAVIAKTAPKKAQKAADVQKALLAKKNVQKGKKTMRQKKIRTSTTFRRPKTHRTPKSPLYPRRSVPRRPRLDQFAVLKHPLTTESAMKKIEDHNTLVFIVDIRAGKRKILDSVKKMYDIKAVSVRTAITYVLFSLPFLLLFYYIICNPPLNITKHVPFFISSPVFMRVAHIFGSLFSFISSSPLHYCLLMILLVLLPKRRLSFASTQTSMLSMLPTESVSFKLAVVSMKQTKNKKKDTLCLGGLVFPLKLRYNFFTFSHYLRSYLYEFVLNVQHIP